MTTKQVVEVFVEGMYTFGKPDYGGCYRCDTGERIYIADYGVPLYEIAKRIENKMRSEGKTWRFIRKYYDRKHRCMVLVFEKEDK